MAINLSNVPQGVVMYDPERQPTEMKNCDSLNCDDICVNTGASSALCLCCEGRTLNSDRRTCSGGNIDPNAPTPQTPSTTRKPTTATTTTTPRAPPVGPEVTTTEAAINIGAGDNEPGNQSEEKKTTTTTTTDNNKESNTLLYAGAGGGAFIMLVVVTAVIIIVILCRRIKRTRNPDDRASFFGSDRQSQASVPKRDSSFYSDIYPRTSNIYAEVADILPDPNNGTPHDSQGQLALQGHMPSAHGGYLQAVRHSQPLHPGNRPISRPFVGIYSNQGDYDMSPIPPIDDGYIGHVGIHNEQPPPYEKLDNNQPIAATDRQPIEARNTIYEEKNVAGNNTHGITYEKLTNNQRIGATNTDEPIEARNTIYEERNNIKVEKNDQNDATGKAYEKLTNWKPTETTNSINERKEYDNSNVRIDEKNVDEK